jgi:hypothetical protein
MSVSHLNHVWTECIDLGGNLGVGVLFTRRIRVAEPVPIKYTGFSEGRLAGRKYTLPCKQEREMIFEN